MASMFNHKASRKSQELPCIFVHAGAGFHSIQNEHVHLSASNDAAKLGMNILRAGGTAVDAVEIAIKVLEDREITNAGYGSNLAMDGVVECDAAVVDHLGRSGACGAVAQIKNPISLARSILDRSTQQLSLRRVPPNLLVGQGATDFAYSCGMQVVPHDFLISPSARERWLRWRQDLKTAERRASEQRALHPGATPSLRSPSMPTIDPLSEDREREQRRQEHTLALASGVWNEGQPISPPPSSEALSAVSPSPIGGSRRSTPASRAPSSLHMTTELPIDQSVQIQSDPFGTPTNMHRDSSRGSLSPPSGIYLADARRPGHVNDGNRSSDYNNDLDVVDPRMIFPPCALEDWKHGVWRDGSSDTDTETSSSQSSLKLPSLTPSPESSDTRETVFALEAATAGVESLDTAAARSLPAAGPSIAKGDDNITDTVGCIAIDAYGNIACGASSGGIGMKHRGRIGPAALVGVGAAVVPVDAEDKNKTSVAAVTSGTGEHMATTMAATIAAERLYHRVKKLKGGAIMETDDDEALRAFIEKDFMEHPSVKNSASAGAIGLLCVKKTKERIYFYFAHNTDSFALASMHADEAKPLCTMSRGAGNGAIAIGGRAVRQRSKKR